MNYDNCILWGNTNLKLLLSFVLQVCVWEFDAARMVAADQSEAARAETDQSEARQR